MLTEKGSLKEISVIKLLLNIYEENLTGILYLKRDIIIKVLYFNRGKLIWAVSNSEVDKLENLLISKGMVKAEVIKRLDDNKELQKSIGKTLVEKGLITLEELIKVTKIQLEKIIFSVLKWNAGAFQFVKDKPPERLLSLDINVTEFVINFILEEIEMTAIWKNIKSLQVVYKKNTDDKKVAKFNLSEKQKELLDSFTRGETLEEILSKQGGAHKDSLLKIVYFYILAELLVPGEKAPQPPPAPDISIPLPSPQPQSPPAPSPAPPPPESDPLTSKDIVIDDEIEIGPLEDDGELDKLSDFTLGEVQEEKGASPKELIKEIDQRFEAGDEQPEPRLSPRKGEESRKLRFVWSFIFLILIIAAVILLVLNHLNKTEGEELSESQNQAQKKIAKRIDDSLIKPRKETKPIDNGQVKDDLSLNKQEDKSGTKTEVIKMQKQTGEDATKDKKKPPEIDNKEQSKEQISKTNLESKDKKESSRIDKDKAANKQDAGKDLAGKDAFSYFKQKKLVAAADVWKEELKKNRITHSILLEMDCIVDSVFNAYDKIIEKKDFFILSTIRNGKTCYLVFWGKFKSEAAAIDAIKMIPDFFFKQSPPRVIDLSLYME